MTSKMEEKKHSCLFVATKLDIRDELEERMERGHEHLTKVTAGMMEKESHDALTAVVSKGLQQHEEITLGLMYTILTDAAAAPRAYRDLTLITRDGFGLVWSRLNQLVIEKYTKLQENIRTQVVWLARELVKNSVVNADQVISSLIRQIAGGDISPKNVWLAESMLDLFTENRTWLDKHPTLLAMVLYTYLRIIEDHSSKMWTHLREREVDFCIQLLRSKFNECCRIGRDLVRLLQSVARIPEFEKLWKDMLYRPQTLSPQFTGIMQLLNQRTSHKFLACRLTPDMEKKMIFLTSKVRFGNQKRYQDWFQKQYLATPESQSLRCDLIRYICCCIHPSNEVLCSDVIQRWAVIGWLLTTCTSNVAASCAKLALFYDWLFFNPARGNIMDIEPAILVMHHSLRTHPAITVTLLDFLCRIIYNFFPSFEPQVKQGVIGSLKFILEKRVLPSLSPLFDNTKMDKELRAMIRETFSEFCTAEAKPESPVPDAAPEPIPTTNNNSSGHFGHGHRRHSSEDAAFSDEEDEDRGRPNPVDMLFRPIKQEEEVNFDQLLDEMEGDIKKFCASLLEQRDDDVETQCETMQELCSYLLEMSDFDGDTATPLAHFLCNLYNQQFVGNILPEEINDETMEDALGKPLFVMFRNLSQDTEDNSCPIQLLILFCSMYEKHPKLGYLLLFFLHASSKDGESKLHVYEELCKNTESRDLAACLVKDFTECQENDVNLLCYLVPPVYTQFADRAMGCIELLHIIVSCIDSSQLQGLICDIMQGSLIVFNKDKVANFLESTLEWETFEQFCVWQLLLAHDDIEVEHLVPLIPKLKYKEHPEALANMLLMLKLERASQEFLKPLLSRKVESGDRLTASILSHWASQDEQHLADAIKGIMVRAANAAKRIRQRQTAKQNYPTPAQILGHLDGLRHTSASRQTLFFRQESLLHGLHQFQNVCTESQKTKFSDLFALVEDLEDASRTTRSRLARRSPGSTSPRARKSQPVNNDETSSSEEDDEVKFKSKPAKKRKKASVTGSDSD
ncbi:integrator complex subunit 3-like [Diadema antillarum]|uniref:integrator complex subunit 3-like n=1 Tax=Diadema antillarum TaxID=105358 RepID=UPI003A8A8E85